MTPNVSHREAHLALEAVQRQRLDVVAELDVPRWYWPVMALGWVGLGVLADFGPPWASSVAVVAFGAAQATTGQRALSGRHGSRRVSIRGDLVSHWVPLLIVAFLAAMVVVTVAIALVFNADGARHPAAFAGAIVAVLVVALGPQLMRWLRARALRRSAF